jgi:hypothetical protein
MNPKYTEIAREVFESAQERDFSEGQRTKWDELSPLVKGLKINEVLLVERLLFQKAPAPKPKEKK